MKFNIAIDGPSAAGKSSIAKILAKKYDFAHLDTGAMYRSVALYTKMNNIDEKDEEKIVEAMANMDISFNSIGNVFINGEDVSTEIRTNEMSMRASNISALAKVREELVRRQQAIAKDKGFILDGRDIGTVVLPDAEIKIFLVASAKARADRRYKEYQDKGVEADYDTILKDIEIRDHQDSTRDSSPLKQAEDAILLDTSNMNIKEVEDKLVEICNSKLSIEV